VGSRFAEKMENAREIDKKEKKNDVLCPAVEMLKSFTLPVRCIMRHKHYSVILRKAQNNESSTNPFRSFGLAERIWDQACHRPTGLGC